MVPHMSRCHEEHEKEAKNRPDFRIGNDKKNRLIEELYNRGQSGQNHKHRDDSNPVRGPFNVDLDDALNRNSSNFNRTNMNVGCDFD